MTAECIHSIIIIIIIIIIGIIIIVIILILVLFIIMNLLDGSGVLLSQEWKLPLSLSKWAGRDLYHYASCQLTA